MNKKEAILQILKKLKPHWDMAEMFIQWVEKNMLDDDMIDQISKALKKSILHVKTQRERDLFATTHQKIEDIRRDEHHEVDEKAADLLLDQL